MLTRLLVPVEWRRARRDERTQHGVPDEDMLHALRHHSRAFETDDPDVTMFIGPSSRAEPLEVGVVADDEGTAVIHAMKAREKFLKGWWIR